MSDLTTESALDGNPNDPLTISRGKLCRLLAAAHHEGRTAGRVDIKRMWPEEYGDHWPEPITNPFLGGPNE